MIGRLVHGLSYLIQQQSEWTDSTTSQFLILRQSTAQKTNRNFKEELKTKTPSPVRE